MLADEILRPSTALKGGVACCAIVSALLAAAPESAWAQAPAPAPSPAPATTAQNQASVPADGTEEEDEEEIVVTGTLIRGVEPIGANTIGISAEDVKLSGVVDSNALLATLVPQSEGFMDLLEPGRGSNLGITRVPVIRPSLRNLGDSFNGSGTLTLVLLDGGRIVPAGIEQSVVDVGIIPPNILERTEIILDGTSAVYGSDAVGGTINYIPRKRFDEIRVGATYGFADDYYSVSADASAGTSWRSGGIGFAYSFGKNSNILEGDRDYAIARNYLEGGRLTQLACDGYGHITIGTAPNQRRFLSTTLEERTDWCDLGFATYTPAQERHSGFFVFSQDITSTIKFDVSAFYSERTTVTNFGPYTSSVTVRPTNPYFRPVIAPGISPTANQTVAFQWGPIFGNDAFSSETFLKVAQVSPSITVDLGSDWQVRFLGAYGKSTSSVDQHNIDTLLVGRLAGGQAGFQTTATAINPYDITATVNKALFDNLRWHDLRDGKHTFYQARAVADGPLFSMPGGEVRVALGVEWSKTDFKRRITDQTTHILGPYSSASASNKSVFGEVNVPFVSEDNAMPGIAGLTLSASARYDDYASFGGTFNPKFALTYQPVTWVTLRGNWGKSFRAPNAVDKLGSSANTIICVGTNLSGCTNFPVGVPTGFPAPITPPDTQLTLSGTNPNLEPEQSTNWAIGADLQPPFIPGLTLNATYWSVKFKNAIGFPPIDINALLSAAPELITFCPCTPEQLADFASRAPNGQNVLNIVSQGGYNILYLRDNSITNLTAREVRGLDASLRYNRPTSFGSIDAFINGAWILRGRVQLGPSSPVTNEIAVGTSNFRATAGIGANIGDFRAQVTMQHRAGFDVAPAANRDPNQTHVPSYQIFNTSFRWNVNGGGLAKDLALTLVINNIFDNAPPVNRTTAGTTINGNTIGRVIQFGIEKSF